MSSVIWSEELNGWLSRTQTDFNQAMLEGKREGRPICARLTLETDELDDFVRGPRRRASVSGEIDCPELLGSSPITWGEFELLAPGSELFDQLHMRMRYRLNLRNPHGHDLCLSAFKLIENDPGYDSWLDTTTLFVRIYAGSWSTTSGPEAARARDEQQAGREELPELEEDLTATAVLRIKPGAFLRELASFHGSGPRGTWPREVMRYNRCFAEGLARVYFGRPIPDGRPSFPLDHPRPPWRPDRKTYKWHPVPGRQRAAKDRPALEREIVPFEVDDLAFPLNLHHIRRAGSEAGGAPVVLIPGAAMRAEMFYGQPVGETIVDRLLREEKDVWIESWRASIDLPANSYTLDQAARQDHPRAVQKVIDETGAESIAAVVHCQGSVGFVMAAAAGYLPQGRVSHVVSNAISLFFEVPGRTWLKQRLTLPAVGLLGKGGDPQWGIRPQTPASTLLAKAVPRMKAKCGNAPCEIANYLFGSGADVLLLHDNIDERVHDWSSRELGYTPFSMIRQVAESCRYGHIVPAKRPHHATPPSYIASKPRTDAKFTFIAGSDNRMFEPGGQLKTAEFFTSFGLQADFRSLPGYGHLDTFWGEHAPAQVYPVILQGLTT